MVFHEQGWLTDRFRGKITDFSPTRRALCVPARSRSLSDLGNRSEHGTPGHPLLQRTLSQQRSRLSLSPTGSPRVSDFVALVAMHTHSPKAVLA